MTAEELDDLKWTDYNAWTEWWYIYKHNFDIEPNWNFDKECFI